MPRHPAAFFVAGALAVLSWTPTVAGGVPRAHVVQVQEALREPAGETPSQESLREALCETQPPEGGRALPGPEALNPGPFEEAALPANYAECIRVGGHPGGRTLHPFCFLEVDAERGMARFEHCIESGGSVFVTGGDHPSYECVLMFRGPGD